MNEAYRRLEEIARENGLTPSFLRKIVYLGALGYRNKDMIEETDISETTIIKYRRILREMDEEEAREIFQLVAEIKGISRETPRSEPEPVEG